MKYKHKYAVAFQFKQSHLFLLTSSYSIAQK